MPAIRCSGTWRRISRLPPELVLNAPVRQPVGAPFPVQVLAYADDGTATPAAGAVISGSGTPVTTDASGNALVERQRDGPAADPGDPRRRHPQRGDADLLVRHGHRLPGSSRTVIVGSDTTDDIAGTAGQRS